MESRELYACLNPCGVTPEKLRIPLTAPRLDTLEDKTILVVMHEMDPNLMPEVHEQLLKQIAGINVVWWDFRQHGDLRVQQIPQQQKLNAAIVGVGF